MSTHRSLETVRGRLKAEGITVSAWARSHGFQPAQVYQVLTGKVAGTRGISHEIAVRLGLKPAMKEHWFAEGNTDKTQP